MTWQYSFLTDRNPPKPVIVLVQDRAKHIYKLMLCRNHVLLAKLKKCARFYFGDDMFASISNEAESRYLLEKSYFVTSRK